MRAEPEPDILSLRRLAIWHRPSFMTATLSIPATARCSTSPPGRPGRPGRCRSPPRCCASAPPAISSAGPRTRAWAGNRGAGRPEFLILSTQGGIRAPDGTPIALGYHTGHWEVGLLMEAAAREFKAAGAIPFAGACTDPCDGRSQGTAGMFDSLPYRNDAAIVFRRLIRSLPTRSGVIGVATCDKGLPAMMMALASMHDLPCVLVPGGVTLLPTRAKTPAHPDDWRALCARRNHAPGSRRSRLPCLRLPGRRLPVPRHRGHLAGRRRSARHVARPFRARAFRPSDLARHGQASAPALMDLEPRRVTMRDILTDAASECDGHARGVRRIDESDPAPPGHRPRRGPGRPTAADWTASTAAFRAWSTRCPTARAPSDRPGVSGRRRAGSDAAPAPCRAARHAAHDRQR